MRVGEGGGGGLYPLRLISAGKNKKKAFHNTDYTAELIKIL